NFGRRSAPRKGAGASGRGATPGASLVLVSRRPSRSSRPCPDRQAASASAHAAAAAAAAGPAGPSRVGKRPPPARTTATPGRRPPRPVGRGPQLLRQGQGRVRRRGGRPFGGAFGAAAAGPAPDLLLRRRPVGPPLPQRAPRGEGAAVPARVLSANSAGRVAPR